MSVEKLVKQARYYVGNPSAWEAYDEGASEIIRSVVNKLEELAAERDRSAREWREAFDNMHRRAMEAEAALAEKDKEIAVLGGQLDDMKFLSVEGFLDWRREQLKRDRIAGGTDDA